MFHFLGGVLFPPQNGQVQVGWWIKGLKTSLKSRGFNDIQWSVAICRCVHACFGSCCGVDVVWFSPNHVGSVCWKLTKQGTDSPESARTSSIFLFPLLFFTNQIPSCFSSTFYLRHNPPTKRVIYQPDHGLKHPSLAPCGRLFSTLGRSQSHFDRYPRPEEFHEEWKSKEIYIPHGATFPQLAGLDYHPLIRPN